MAYLVDRRMTGDPNPAEVITVTIGSKTFRAGRRTAAHLMWTQERLTEGHADATLRVIQGCYNTGVPASAGTHDEDGCLDVQIVGMGWRDAERFLREHGWAAWYRYPPLFGEHIHMVSLGCPGPVGVYVPGQVSDYYAHRTGLAGHATDDTWHPTDIDSTVFDYAAWIEEQDVSPEQEDRIVNRVVKALTEGKPAGSDLSRDALLKQAQKASIEARNLIEASTKKAAKK